MKKSFIAIICLLSLVFTFVGNGIIVYAQDSKYQTEEVTTTLVEKNTTISATKVAENMSLIEQQLSSKGTDVITELRKQIDYYQNMLNTFVSQEQAEQIEGLISATQEIINEYQVFKNSEQTRGEFHLVYTSAVATVIAFFNSQGYNLSAELLTHARDNNDLDSIYNPIDGNDVLSSSVYASIRNGSILEGTGTFGSSNNTNDQDLYYAIKAFYYSKSASGRVVVIQDRYDYAYDENNYETIAGIAINTMYAAQEAGVIVPYYSVITNNFDGTSSNQSETVNIGLNKRYYEDRATIGKGEYKDYYITFRGSGIKVFQTLGTKDTYLSLYDSDGNLMRIDDDSGYKTNSLITSYCSANVQYKIRVKFYSSTQSGETKLAITPSYGSLKSGTSELNTYEDLYNTTSSNFTFNTFSEEGYVRLLTYTPSEKAYYTVETEGYTDTYIYLIDPRSTYLLSSSNYNDDGGEENNARLNKELAVNIPYLIIYSEYSLTDAYSSFSLRIYKN